MDTEQPPEPTAEAEAAATAGEEDQEHPPEQPSHEPRPVPSQQGPVMPIGGAGILEVLGSNMVTIIDGRNATSDYFKRDVGEVLTVVRSSLHVLGHGRRFDLNRREPLDF